MFLRLQGGCVTKEQLIIFSPGLPFIKVNQGFFCAQAHANLSFKIGRLPQKSSPGGAK
jgi:hypothetical protein